MQIDKQELLTGEIRIEEFNDDFLRCFLFPVDTHVDTENLSVVVMADEYSLGGIPYPMNKLLCRWLKITKYFTIPDGWDFAAFLFLQAFWYTTNCRVELWNDNSKIKWTNSFDPPPDAAGKDLLKQRLLFRFMSSAYCRRVLYIYSQLPFVFVHLYPHTNLLSPGDINCSHEFLLLPTSEPSIMMLIFSTVLNSTKDCARLFREYLKRPSNVLWRTDYQISAFDVEMECGIPFDLYIPSLSSIHYTLPRMDNFDTDLISAVMNQPARQIHPVIF